MHLYAKTVSAVASGDYYQVHLGSEDSDDEQINPFDQPAPYLMVQRQFEFFDGGKCYVESDSDEYIGHFQLRLLEFSPTRLAFAIARRKNTHVEVGFALTAAEYQEAEPIVKIIFGMREPDNDAQYFDGAL